MKIYLGLPSQTVLKLADWGARAQCYYLELYKSIPQSNLNMVIFKGRYPNNRLNINALATNSFEINPPPFFGRIIPLIISLIQLLGTSKNGHF